MCCAVLCCAVPCQQLIVEMQTGDVGATPEFDGDHVKALASIKAKTVVMPAERDLYIPVADEEYEVGKMPNAELHVIPGDILQVAGQTLRIVISLRIVKHAMAVIWV